jgi:hypothetical protein
MGVIKLNLVFLWEVVPVSVELLESSDDISDRGATEEVLLLQSQLFTSL